VSDEHLSLDELAELDEGLLDPERARAARAHLDTCAQCRAAAEAITSTRTALAAMPAAPMPDDVKARLDRALANAATPPSTVVPNLEEHRKRRFGRPSLPASAAASVILLAFAAIVVAAVMHGGGATSSGGASESAAAPSGLPNSTAAPVQPQNYTRTSTDQTYTPSRLLADVPGLVAGLPSGGFSADENSTPTSSAVVTPGASAPAHTLESGPVPAALRPLYNSRTKLLACAAFLTGIKNAVPLTVDFGRWTNATLKGTPAAVFVMRDPSPSVVDVYVTGPACDGGSLRTYVKIPVQ
jgi:hypothetical protein